MGSSEKNAPEKKAFKDWFDKEAARALAAQVGGAHRGFDRQKFVRKATRNLSKLEFAGRVNQFSAALAETLPSSVPKALEILTKSLPPVLVDCENVTDGWLQWPVGQFIADHGLPHFDESMSAMHALTQRFSSEFAVRPFVEAYPDRVFPRLLSLTEDSSPHVRRWCSEGVRPRLPWGKKLRALVEDPEPIWPILEALKDDDELYVRRSVANNANDIAKDHPAVVVKRCKAWSKGGSAERTWVINHALRSLIKQGDSGALTVVGYAPPKKLTAALNATKKTKIGGSVELTAELRSSLSRTQKLLVDYVVHYVRKGDKTSEKVFKWAKTEIGARGELSLTKKHSMKVTTIRALYPGVHRVDLQVNGVRVASTDFRLQP